VLIFKKTWAVDVDQIALKAIRKLRAKNMTFWQRVKFVSSNIFSFLAPFIAVFLSSIGPVLSKAALNAAVIVEAELKGQGSDIKRGAAFRLIAADLKNQGITLGVGVTVQMINSAIEAAVAKLNAEMEKQGS